MKNDIRAKYSYTLGKWVVTMQGKIVEQFDDLENARTYKADLQRAERVKRATNNLYNNDLHFDLDRIKGFDAPITIAKAYDCNLDSKYAIDIEDTSYWYTSKQHRDRDYARLKHILPNFKFIN